MSLIKKTAGTKTGKTAIIGLVVSMVTATVGFSADFARTFDMGPKLRERVDLVESFLNEVSDAAIPLLFAGAFLFRGISKKDMPSGEKTDDKKEDDLSWLET